MAGKLAACLSAIAIVSQSDIKDAMTNSKQASNATNAEAAEQQNEVQKQFGQGFGRIESMRTDSDDNSQTTTPRVDWLFFEWVGLGAGRGSRTPKVLSTGGF